MKKILLTVFICIAFCGLSIQAATIKQNTTPEAATIIKEHHAGAIPAQGRPAMHHGGGHPPMTPHMGRPPMGPPPPPRHHRYHNVAAPYYVGVRYVSPYYYNPYYDGPYEYYDPYYYTYPVRRPVVKYRVQSVGFTVVY